MTAKFRVYITAAIVIFILAAILANSTFITLKPGEKGIIFRRFGGGLDKEHIYNAGFHVLMPWNDMIVYNVREQTREEAMDVLDKNGLSINVDITVRFFPEHKKIGFLHETFGTRYIDVLVVAEVRSSVRQVMGRYTAEEIYSTKRKEVEDAIINETKETLGTDRNNIEMTALLIRSINLPQQIKGAIETKLKQEQEFLAYQYKLQRETSEAERKRIEAEGIANFNKIINSSLTDAILKQRGIEATLDLANSPNAKVVVVGGGKEGLPLILGNN